jgi:hypothetical protein
MAFASTIVGETVFGNKRVHTGTFTNAGGDSGGNINTGLNLCEFISLQVNSAAVVANVAVTNETFPVAGAAVTIVTNADDDGTWWAYGN